MPHYPERLREEGPALGSFQDPRASERLLASRMNTQEGGTTMNKKKSVKNRKHRRRLWMSALFGVALIIGAARLSSQEVTASLPNPLSRPQPRLLTRREAERGLAQRFVAMQRRRHAYSARRRAGAVRDYRVPEPPPGAMVPARPDTPEGEMTKQRQEASR